jgi:hypothetical protein
MTRQTRTIVFALCVACLFATQADAQTRKIDDDLLRAQEILNTLATAGLAQGSRTSLEEELAGIEAHEYVVRVKLQARKYTAGSGYFPVTVVKPGLLEPAAAGRLEMPKAAARRAKPQFASAYGVARVRVSPVSPTLAIKLLQSVWVDVDGVAWPVTSNDPRLPSSTHAPEDRDDSAASSLPTEGLIAASDRPAPLWTRLEAPLTKYQALATLPDGTLLAGTGGRAVYRIYPTGSTAHPSRDGMPGGKVFIAELSICGPVVVAGTWRPPHVTMNAEEGIYRSTDGGLTWALSNEGLPFDRRVSAFAWDGASLYVSLSELGVYCSDDAGLSWKASSDGLPIGALVSALHSAGPALLAGVWRDGVYRSDSKGEKWQRISQAPRFPKCFVADGDGLFAGGWEGGGVLRSVDGGTTWTQDRAGLTHRFIRATAAHDGVVYAGSWEGGGGVFASADAGATWHSVSDGLEPPRSTLPNSMWIGALEVVGGHLFAGTGDGLYRARLPLLQAEVAHVPDPNLEAAIRDALGGPAGPLTTEMLASLTVLDASRRGIADITGLERATGLQVLRLNRNRIADLVPLARLTNLQSLDVGVNGGIDPTPLASLAALNVLNLQANPSIGDLTFLRGLASLRDLNLYSCGITTLADLQGLGALRTVHLGSNLIADLAPLVANAGLAEGTVVRLWGNPLSEEALTTQIPELMGRGVQVDLGAEAAIPPQPTGAPRIGEPAAVPAGAAVLPDSFRARAAWLFDEGNGSAARDASGNGASGTLTEGAAWGEGRFGAAMDLGAATAHMEATYTPDLRLGGSDFTMTMWIRNSEKSGAAWAFMSANDGGGANLKWIWGYRDGASALHINDLTGSFVWLESNPWTPVAERWTHVGLVRHGDTYTHYVDGRISGVVVSSRAFPVPVTGPFTIGSSETSFRFHGLVDEAAVFGQALSKDDIGRLMREGLEHIWATDATSLTGAVGVAASPEPAPAATLPDTTPEPLTIAASPSRQELNAPNPVPATALIVGINAYDHHANLVNPTFDAQAVARGLQEAYQADTTALLDATKVEFLTALHALADRDYADDEQLLVFFSGHGYFDERIRRGYLALKDSLPLEDDPLFQSYVSHEDVRVLLERLDCNHVLLVVDSCFSGTLDPMVAMGSGARPIDGGGIIPKDEYIQRKLRYRTRRYITAGGKEYVPDGRPGQHSPFARQFLAALRTFGGSDGILTLEEILLHLERVDPEPRAGELFGNEPGSSFVLVAGPLAEELQTKFSSLVVTVTPPDAQVQIVGGPPAAESLLKTLRIDPVGTAQRRYHLPVGDYRVRITRDGYVTEERQILLSDPLHRIDVQLGSR